MELPETVINMDMNDFVNEIIDLCKHYFKDGDLTTSDFQGCIDGLVNKFKSIAL